MKKIFLFFIILHFPLVIYGKNYLCIPEISTGIIKRNNGNWKTGSITMSDKYLFSVENNRLISVKLLGNDRNECNEFYSSINSNTFQCITIGYSQKIIYQGFEINTVKLRFTYFYLYGYTQNEEGNTLVIEGGECSSF